MEIGFAETKITPDIGTAKIGWLKLIVPDRIRDSLYARAPRSHRRQRNCEVALAQLSHRVRSQVFNRCSTTDPNAEHGIKQVDA